MTGTTLEAAKAERILAEAELIRAQAAEIYHKLGLVTKCDCTAKCETQPMPAQAPPVALAEEEEPTALATTIQEPEEASHMPTRENDPSLPENWDRDKLKDFLAERGVEYNDRAKTPTLVTMAEAELQKMSEPQKGPEFPVSAPKEQAAAEEEAPPLPAEEPAPVEPEVLDKEALKIEAREALKNLAQKTGTRAASEESIKEVVGKAARLDEIDDAEMYLKIRDVARAKLG